MHNNYIKTVLKNFPHSHDIWRYFCMALYTHRFGNVHPFPKQTILLSIRVVHITFIKFYAHNNYVETHFKELPYIQRNAFRYFLVSLYMYYQGNVHQKLYSNFRITHKHLYQISSKSGNICDRYRVRHRQIRIQTPKTFGVQCRALLTLQQ